MAIGVNDIWNIPSDFAALRNSGRWRITVVARLRSASFPIGIKRSIVIDVSAVAAATADADAEAALSDFSVGDR